MHNNNDNAIEFQPFDSLKGFRQCLREKEKKPVDKKELMEDECERLNSLFQRLHKGLLVKVTYYAHQQYLTIQGVITKIDRDYCRMIFINQQRISFYDIMDIEIME